MCEKYAFQGKGRLFTVIRPQAEFDDCLWTANFAGNIPTTALIGRRSLILSVRGTTFCHKEVRKMIETETGGQ